MSSLRRIRRKRGKSGQCPGKPTESSGPERVELQMSELEAILERVKASLNQEEYDKLHAALETLLFVTQELEKNRVSVQRLKRLLFGATTEKTRQVFEKALEETGVDTETSVDDDPPKPEPPREKVKVAHPSLQGGDSCPSCKKGKVYETTEPARLVRICGQAPLGARVYELQKLRCNLCGKIFTAPAPLEVGSQKYDAESASMIALLKYGSGLPFNRLERLQGSLGIPLPAATQWEIVRDSADQITPVFETLIRQAAQGRVLHNDDTTMKVLALASETKESTDGDMTQISGRM